MMNRTNQSLLAALALVAALGTLSSCNETTSGTTTGSSANVASNSQSENTRHYAHIVTGANMEVALASAISSETARSGDSWEGTLTHSVMDGSNVVVPSGAPVSGVITSSVPAKRGSRAMLSLAVRSVEVDGRSRSVNANTEPVVAGSPRARNLGAIAGGAAAGALIGKHVGDDKNGAVGGLIGGAIATGIVAGSSGYQVVLKEGTVLSFTVDQTVSMR